MNWPLVLPMFVYLLATLLVGLWAATHKKTDSPEDYYLAGRSLGGFVLALTLVTTFASASSFIGGPGIASRLGLSWVYLAMIQVPTAWVTLGLLGKRFALTARRVGAVTVTGWLRERYGSRGVAAIASLALLTFFIAAITAQFVGGARLFQAATGLDYRLCLALFAGTVILYTSVGGAHAVALTDTLQGLVMILGTALLLVAVGQAAGGLDRAFIQLKALNPELVSVHGPGGAVSWPQLWSFWILVCFGVAGLPHTASRGLSYNNSKAMHRAMIVGTPVLAFILLGMTLCGAFAPLFLPSSTEPDLMMPTLAKHLLPGWAAGVFLAGPLAGMMSTLDTQLLQMAGTVTQDLTRLGQGDIRHVKKHARTMTVALGILVFLLALRPPQFLVWLNLFALGGLEAVFFWPLILGLYWKRGNAAAAYSSIIAGLATYFAAGWLSLGGAHRSLPALLCAGAVYLLVGLCTRPQSKQTLSPFFDDTPERSPEK